MANPVWVLSVDLQTKTATFQSGMNDAAKSARGAFTDIKSGGADMSREMGGNMMEARHGVMLLGEEFGVHLPRALTTFIASIGPIGAAMEAAFPFLAIAVGATLLIEHLVKMREEGEKLTENQLKFGTAVQNAFNSLDDKLLTAQIKADELNKDHLGALHLTLELIDKQSMAELVHSFGEVAKAADIAFGDIKSHWYTFGIGATGAKHALDGFQAEYDSLLAQGKNDEATGLLKGTLEQAQKTLTIQEQLRMLTFGPGHKLNDVADVAELDILKAQLAAAAGKAGWTDKEVTAQETLIQALQAQLSVEDRIAALKKIEDSNATKTTHKEMDKDAAEAAKRSAEEAKALARGKAEMSRLIAEAYRKDVAEVEQGEREEIDATRQGSAARLAAIDAAIKHEETLGLQETAFYRGLLTTRIQLVRQMTEEELKLKAEAAREEADNTFRMGEIAIAAEREQSALILSGHLVSRELQIAEELHFAEEEHQLRAEALADKIAALDKSGRDYENKLKALHNKELQELAQYENQKTAIKDKAEKDRNQRILAAEDHFNDAIANGLSSVLMRHQTFANMMGSLGDQVASQMMTNAIKSALAMDFSKEKDAAHAARKAFTHVMDALPFPADVIVAPIAAAGAFAAVMAFEKGGLVPGAGTGDTVPAMLTPGEHVSDKRLTQGLQHMVDSGGPRGDTYHMRYAPTFHVQTIDSSGVQDMLKKHTDEFSKHFQNEVRKMNR